MVLSQFNGKSGLFTFDKVSLIINVAAGLRTVLAECSAPFAESKPPRIDPYPESHSVYMGFTYFPLFAKMQTILVNSSSVVPKPPSLIDTLRLSWDFLHSLKA